MERGLIGLFTQTSFTSTSTIEDIAAYLKGVAQRLCSISNDLVIFEELTVAENHEAKVFVGYENEPYPILMLANHFYNNNYLYSFGICLTNDIGAQITLNSNSVPNTNAQFFNTSSANTVWMSYLKTGSTIIFAFDQNSIAPSYSANWTWIITKASTGSGSVPLAMHLSGYYGYVGNNSRLWFSTYPQWALLLPDNILSSQSPLLPKTKEALIDQDLYLKDTDGAKITGFRLYSNKMLMSVGSIIEVAGAKYFLMYRYNTTFPVLALRIEEEQGGTDQAS